MSKFKIGDNVRRIGTCDQYSVVGFIKRSTDAKDAKDPVICKYYTRDNLICWDEIFSEEELELVPHTNKTISLTELFSDFSDIDVKISELRASISKAIYMKRLKMKMSQIEFANILGVSLETVDKWEGYEYDFTLRDLSFISMRLGINFELQKH